MNQNEINNFSYVRGKTNPSDVKNVLEYIDNATQTEVVSGAQLMLLLYFDDKKHNEEEYSSCGHGFNPIINSIPKPTLETLVEWDADNFARTKQNFIVVKNNGINDEFFLTETEKLKSDFAVLGISGSCTQNVDVDLLRLVQRQLQSANVTLVTRNAGNTRKIISLRSEKYGYIPQKYAFELAEKICENATIEKVDIDNYRTYVKFAFEDKVIQKTYGQNKIITIKPVIWFENSDAGEAAMQLRIGYDINNSQIMSGKMTVAVPHRGDFTTKKEAVFVEQATKLLEKFNGLCSMYDALEQEKIAGSEVQTVIENLINDVVKEQLGLPIKKDIANVCFAEIGERNTDGAELVITLQSLADSIVNLSDNQHRVLSKCFAELPYAKIRRKVAIKK